MRSVLLALIFVSLNTALASEQKVKEKESSVVFGILFKADTSSFSKDPKFKTLIKKHNLQKKKYFKSLSVYQYASINNSTENELKSLCKDLLTISEIEHCELDYKLKADDKDCETCERDLINVKPLEEILSDSQKVTEKFNCKYFNKERPSHNVSGLTKFWAQEYTGADLVREELKSVDTSKVFDLVGVWDSDVVKHGEHVSNLIASSKSSAIIPISDQKKLNYEKLESVGSYLDGYEKLVEKCLRENSCPQYLNNSMGWKGSELIASAVDKLTNTGKERVFITTAGNENIHLRKQNGAKCNLSKKDGVIIVASHGYNGYRSFFSNYSDQIMISAPSNNEVTSYDDSGSEKAFGGTSGAAPQVTGALAAFTLVTGFNLNTKQSKLLLENTATPFYPRGSLAMGAGHLNSYKMHAVAKK